MIRFDPFDSVGIFLGRDLVGGLDNALVAEMQAVEIADGHYGAFGNLQQAGDSAEDLHALSYFADPLGAGPSEE